VGALIAAVAFEIVLHAANLEVTDKNPGSNVTAFNLVFNPSADSGTAGWGADHGKVSSVPSSKPGVLGSNAFRLTPDNVLTTASAYPPPFKVTPGEDLTASAYLVSLPNPGTVTVSIDWKTGSDEYISSSSPGAAITKAGIRASVSATAPKRARKAAVLVNLLGAKPGSYLEFDAVVAEKAAR
jgi:hypothetical protein